MNEEYLAAAKKKVKDIRFLINGASKRATELARGARPLVPTLPQDERSYLDIALLEIAEGKVVLVEDDGASAGGGQPGTVSAGASAV